MARSVEETADSDARAPPPRANADLIGHEGAERELRRLHELGRLPHAILLCGPRGIGKATLAFRLAKFLLAESAEGSAAALATRVGGGLALDPESSVFRRVASGGHADLLTVERTYDPRRRRLRSEILVDDAREIAGFFRLTAAEGGWRIVIVDSAEEMNRNAANALLKILEEPPRHGLLLMVSHQPGQLLPTILSRCRRFSLSALSQQVVRQLLRRFRPELAEAESEVVAALAEGSIGRALELADAGGLALYRSLLDMLSQVPLLDIAELYSLADKLARPDAEASYRIFQDLLSQLLALMITTGARRRLEAVDMIAGQAEVMQHLAARADPVRWAVLRDEIGQRFIDTDLLNLDRKQAVLGAFFAIAEIAR